MVFSQNPVGLLLPPAFDQPVPLRQKEYAPAVGRKMLSIDENAKLLLDLLRYSHLISHGI
jgi:hypothetical protein